MTMDTGSEDPLDQRHMSRALALARHGLYTTDPNPRVGCVVVNRGTVVGEGWHRRAGEPHAEILALREAGPSARGATAYVSLEPCCHTGRTPPCTNALIDAGVARVVSAMLDPNPEVSGRGNRHLEAAGVSTTTGVLETQAVALNRGFLTRMRSGRPYVRCKLAMSLDGRTAMASGESRWITGPEARQDVHRWRARSGAVITGIGTVLADDPAMTVRLHEFSEDGDGDVAPPLRVVVDSRGRTPARARIVQPPVPTVVVTAVDAADRPESGVEVLGLPGVGDRVSLTGVLDMLGQRGVNEAMIEAGATLSGAFLGADLIDEVVIYIAPVLLGDAARGLFHLPGIDRIADQRRLCIEEIYPIGEDWRIVASCRDSSDAWTADASPGHRADSPPLATNAG